MQYFRQLVKKYVPYGTWKPADLSFLILSLILISIPFSIREVIESPTNYYTSAYSDFTSISIYLSDFLILAYIGLNWRKLTSIPWPITTALCWLLIELLVNKGEFYGLQVYFTARLAILVFFAITLSNTEFSRGKLKIFAIMATFAGFIQSIIALLQFALQKSLGLYLIGESHLSPNLYGVAKIVAHGTKLIRGYGTFPHSNLLSAFLVITTLLNLYLLTKTQQKYLKLIFSLTFLGNFLGIFVSLSRGGISALFIAIILLVISMLVSRNYKLLSQTIILCLICTGIGLAIFYPYLSGRATVSDDAVKERLFYNKIGESMIKTNWLFGTSPGTSVLHMEQFSPVKLEPWEIQPIHNYYLLAIAEWGIGALFLLMIILKPLYNSFRISLSKIKNTDETYLWGTILTIIGIIFLYLFLFDHYFYTIWPTQVLLWMFIGLIMANNKAETNKNLQEREVPR